MANLSMPLDELLDKVKNTENIDFLRETVEWMANAYAARCSTTYRCKEL